MARTVASRVTFVAATAEPSLLAFSDGPVQYFGQCSGTVRCDMIALPPWDQTGFSSTEESVRSLYHTLLRAEATADSESKRQRVVTRIVRHLLLVPLARGVRSQILREAALCNSQEEINDALYRFGERYLKLICLFRNRREVPEPSEHPSRPSFYSLVRAQEFEFQQSPIDHWTSKVQALRRDNFSCMVTSSLDAERFKAGRPLAPGQKAGNTEYYLIFPRPPEDIDTIRDPNREGSYVASICMLLERLGYAEIAQRLQGATLYQLENVMTLSGAVHNRMDDMDLWFEAVEGQTVPPRQHCYHVRLASPGTHASLQIERQVQFVAHANLPLPDPEYLRVHAICCQVAHSSGAAQYLDDVERSLQGLPVLAEDGSSIDVLDHALRRIALMV